MKIIVCVSRTPETTARIAFTNQNAQYDESGVNFIMNPYDEWYALVRALELKESIGGTVTLLHVGTSVSDQIIRKGLAIGADDAIRVDAEARDAFFVASQIAEIVRTEEVDLVFLGKETIDHNGSEVGSMVSGILQWPFISYANQLEYNDGNFTIDREIEGGVEVLRLKPPFILSAAKGLAEQRIPNMRGIMMAKTKPLKVLPPVDVTRMVELTSFELPPVKEGVKMIDPQEMDELVRLLHVEAKVI